MRVLEVFCGTKSFSTECERIGWEVTTLDNRATFNPTICTDVLTWDYSTHPPIDVFWAGVPCTLYSNASFKRKPEVANELAVKTLEILKHFQDLNPNLYYGLENPWSSLLKQQTFMQGIPYRVCDYCQYASAEEGFGYKKRTVIFGNIPWTPKLCPGKGLCENMVGTYHKETAQQGIQRKPPAPLQKKTHTQTQLYRMPPRLCKDLVGAILEPNGAGRLVELE
jgi:hypothetical protein